MVSLTLLVLRVRDLEDSKRFYEAFGFSFVKEKHGDGPEHYASTSIEGFVFELYPRPQGDIQRAEERETLGFIVSSREETARALIAQGFTPRGWIRQPAQPFVTLDPDGRRIEFNQVW